HVHARHRQARWRRSGARTPLLRRQGRPVRRVDQRADPSRPYRQGDPCGPARTDGREHHPLPPDGTRRGRHDARIIRRVMNYSSPTAAAVSVERLHVTRGERTVFDGLNLSIPRGALVGLLGPSGCGKTTLMRSIVGAQKVRSGTVTVLDSPAGSRGLRQRVGYTTQAATVYDDLTVRQNLGYFRAILGAPRSDVNRVIEETELADHADQLVGSLSGGQQSRASLAAALLGSPELLVLDEPTVGLDPVLRVELWTLF